MLELFVCIIGALILLPLSESSGGTSSTCESKYDNRRDLERKYDSMSSSEIEMYMKDRMIYDDYKDYSRETKIQKLVEGDRRK